MGLRELKPFVRRQRRPHFVALETKHSRKRIRHADIVIDDQDAGSGRAVVGGHAAHCGAAQQRRQGAEDGLCYIQAASTGLSPALHSYVLSSEVVLSPILVRPVREQLEHDRVIRLLQAKYKRKFEVAINPGNEQAAAVGTPPSLWYPDLVLFSTEKNRKLLGTVEVETAESVNNLEAMSQWVTFGRQRAFFHLYVPGTNIDTARRLCTDLQVPIAELWAYQSVGDQIRFTLVYRDPAAEAAAAKARPAAEPAASRPRPASAPAAPPRAAAAASVRPAASPARPAAPRPKPARAAAARPTAAARPVRRAAAPAAARRKATAKPTAAPARRPAAKAPARKAAPSRAQKRR